MSDQSSRDSTSTELALAEAGDRTVCFCHNVNLRTLIEAIHNGATTLEKIKAETCASTGCGGCEWDVIDMLEVELARKP